MKAGANIVKAERNVRMRALAAQIEKLSWMIEYMDTIDCYSKEAEDAWLARGQ